MKSRSSHPHKTLSAAIGLVVVLLIVIPVSMLLVKTTKTDNETVSPVGAVSPTEKPIEKSMEKPVMGEVVVPTPVEKRYEGQFLSFSYPSSWIVEKGELSWGQKGEKLLLTVPFVQGQQSIGFSNLSKIEKPIYIYSDTPVLIGGKEGFRWKGRGDSFISYDYVTRYPTAQGVFNLHVTHIKEDPLLEAQLDNLIRSINFKE